jgi:hypothetical protein
VLAGALKARELGSLPPSVSRRSRHAVRTMRVAAARVRARASQRAQPGAPHGLATPHWAARGSSQATARARPGQAASTVQLGHARRFRPSGLRIQGKSFPFLFRFKFKFKL